MNTVNQRLQQKDKGLKRKFPAAKVESLSTSKEPAPAAVTESTTSVVTRSSTLLSKKSSVLPLVVNEVTNNRVKSSTNCCGDR